MRITTWRTVNLFSNLTTEHQSFQLLTERLFSKTAVRKSSTRAHQFKKFQKFFFKSLSSFRNFGSSAVSFKNTSCFNIFDFYKCIPIPCKVREQF